MEYEKDDCIQDIVYEKYQNSLKDQILAILTLIGIKDYDLAIERIQCLIDNNEEIIVPGFESYGDLSKRLLDYCRGGVGHKKDTLHIQSSYTLTTL